MNLRGNQCDSGYMAPASGLTLQSDQVKSILWLQVVLILGVGVAYLTAIGRPGALSSVYGGGIAVFNTWLLIRRIRLATEAAKSNPGQEVGVLYRGAIQRFAFVFALFVVGMAVLAFEPIPLLVGFAVSQGVFLLGGRIPVFSYRKNKNSERFGVRNPSQPRSDSGAKR